jgi:cytochrome P450
MTEHQIASFGGCVHALKQPNLRQALYDEAALMMEHALVNLHGAEHRARRNVEATVFRKDIFLQYEKTVLPRTLEETIAPFRDAGEGDLVDLGYRIMMNLTVDFAGIDRPLRSAEETGELVRLLKEFSLAPALGQSRADEVAEKKTRVRKAMGEFDTRFLQPSIARRRKLLADRDAGLIADADLPKDVLMALVREQAKLEMTDEQFLQEGIFYALAGAHTTIHSLTHAVNELLQWLAAHPEDARLLREDPFFIQRCVFESVRLHPSSPVAKRRALCPVALDDGAEADTDDTVVIDLRAANRTQEIFGDDADRYNPHREVAGATAQHGISMGLGMHACLGRNLAIGVEPRANSDPQTHQYGTVPLIVEALLKCGIQADPGKAAQKDEGISRISFAYYPIVFRPEEALLP